MVIAFASHPNSNWQINLDKEQTAKVVDLVQEITRDMVMEVKEPTPLKPVSDED